MDMDDFSHWMKVFKQKDFVFHDGRHVVIDFNFMKKILADFKVVVLNSHAGQQGIRLSLTSEIPPTPTKQPNYHWLGEDNITQLDAKDRVIVTLGCESATFAPFWIEAGARAVVSAQGCPDADEIYKIAALFLHKWMVEGNGLQQALQLAKAQFPDGKYDCFQILVS